MIIKGYLFSIGYVLLCLLLSLIAFKLGMAKKYTRKLVHVLVGFEWVILYHFLGAGIHFLVVCIIFLFLLIVAHKGRLMPMIESDDDNSLGTVYYAAAMTGVAFVGCFIPQIMLPFGIGVMCTSVGDGLAGVIGQLIKKYNPKIYGNKTALGTLTIFVGSTLSALVISMCYSMELSLVNCLCIGVLAAGLELVSPFGLDNVSVTWGATILTYLFMYWNEIDNYIIPILATPLIIAFCLSKNALTKGGVLVAVLLDAAVSIAFTNTGFIILCAYFLFAVIIDKIKTKHKNRGRKDIKIRSEQRNVYQVTANGIVAFISSLAFLVTKNSVFAVTFIVSLAESFSDTVASGIGSFSDKAYDLFRGRKCDAGLSGGMSLIGTFSSLIGAFLISAIAWILDFSSFGVSEFLIVGSCAFLGNIFDTFLGSLLQVKYMCSVCGKVTERKEHCDRPAVRISGISFIDNNLVNLLSCLFSSIVALILVILV